MSLHKIITDCLTTQWIAAPAGTKCFSCQSKDIERSWVSLMSGPYSGVLRCKSCGHTESLMSHIGKSILTIEPMPPGAKPIYDKEPQ